MAHRPILVIAAVLSLTRAPLAFADTSGDPLALERFSDPADEQRAQQLLERLQKESPSASLAKKAAVLLSDYRAASSPRPDLAAPVPSPAGQQAPVPPGGPAVVRSVTRSTLPRGERITIEFSQEVTYVGDRIPGPDRVYFDFRNATPSAVAEVQQTTGGTLVKSLRVAPHDARTTRLVLELAESPRYSVFRLYDPFRLVIDVEADTPAASSTVASTPSPAQTLPPALAPIVVPASLPQPPAAVSANTAPPPSAPVDPVALSVIAPKGLEADAPMPAHDSVKAVTFDSPAPAAITSRGDYSLGRQLGLGISRIVIDAGHGGHDPGAQANGVDEAELVLDVALRVEKLLHDESGFDVILTRRTDEFVPLEERTAIANRECADLFLSIHANASREPTVRGIETYFLNFATNPAAEGLAARENATSTKTMGNLPEMVKAITLNNKVSESREMATIVQSTLTKRLTLQNKTVRDLGVKQAPFVVLIGAQMPSVLAEISFLTNRTEAALLKQSAYRQRIAQALADAVVKYRASLKKVTPTVASKGDGQ